MNPKVYAAVMSLVAAFVFAPVAIANSLEGFWTLNEGRGQTASDSSLNANAGTVSGARWSAGKFKSGLAFDGIDDALTIPSTSTNFAALESEYVTVEAWVRRNGSPGFNKHVIAKGANVCNAASYALYTGSTGGIAFYISQGLDFYVSPNFGPTIWDGNWHHVAGTFDGTAVRLFVDGQEVGVGTPAPGIGYAVLPNDLFAGLYAGCGGHNYDGLIDEVRIWSRALEGVELAASAAMGTNANEIKRDGTAAESLVATTNFKAAASGGPVVVSLESSSGLRTITDIRVEASKKGSFSCGGTPCPIVLSNGGRTASLTVTGSGGASGRLRVTLDNAMTLAANVSLG